MVLVGDGNGGCIYAEFLTDINTIHSWQSETGLMDIRRQKRVMSKTQHVDEQG